MNREGYCVANIGVEADRIFSAADVLEGIVLPPIGPEHVVIIAAPTHQRVIAEAAVKNVAVIVAIKIIIASAAGDIFHIFYPGQASSLVPVEVNIYRMRSAVGDIVE